MGNMPPSMAYHRIDVALGRRHNTVEHTHAHDKDWVEIEHAPTGRKKRLFRFDSPRPDAFFPPSHPKYDFSATRSFMARLYVKEPSNHLVIMYNGLDETPHHLKEDALFGFYDRLGGHLAESGFAAILLPTPFHLNRVMMYRDPEKEQRERDGLPMSQRASHFDRTFPTNALGKEPASIYKNHYQGFRETVALYRVLFPARAARAFPAVPPEPVAPITDITRDMILDFISDRDKTSVSLIGYSLGGLRALTEFVHDRRDAVNQDRAPLFTTCVAINSGAALASLPHPSWIKAGRWRDILERLLLDPGSQKFAQIDKENAEAAEAHFSALQDIFLGHAVSLRQIEHRDHTALSKLLFVLGGNDEFQNLDSLKRLASSGGLNLLQLSGMRHSFHFDAWGTWEPPVFEYIRRFMEIQASTMHISAMRSADVASIVALLDHALAGRMLPLNKVDLKLEKAYDDALTVLRAVQRQQLFERVFDSESTKVINATGRGAVDVHEQFASFATSVLVELKTRVRTKRCRVADVESPRLSTYIGHHLTGGNRDLMNLWGSKVAAKLEGGNRFGDAVVKAGLVTEDMRSRAEANQAEVVAQLRTKVRQWFQERCQTLR